jgi:hypothetical protein
MYDIYGKNKITGRFGDKRSYYKPGHFHEGDDIALGLNSPINVTIPIFIVYTFSFLYTNLRKRATALDEWHISNISPTDLPLWSRCQK